MSWMMFTVLDAEQALHVRREARFVDTLIPALSDDPETIEELRHAMRRFLPEDADDPWVEWSDGDADEPADGGICLVDLPARLIVYQSVSEEFLRSGQVTFDEGDEESARWIPYYIAEDWLVTGQLEGWRALAAERRQQRRDRPPYDTREVLYGKVAEFLVDECLAARSGTTDVDDIWSPPANWQWRKLPERTAREQPLSVSDAQAEIHARWLMAPRDDLHGQTPREVLHARHSDVDRHVSDRQHQWSVFGQRPPALWRTSSAYRYGGYGTHEMVVYYDLVRHLVDACWQLVVQSTANDSAPDTSAVGECSRSAIVERLGMVQQEWLHTPNVEDLSGKTAAQVIECERLRLPLSASGEEAMVDCDCPLCQMMADNGPAFWNLDGCNMDEEFPFALFEATREEWEEKQRYWAAVNAKWERERQARAAAGEDDAEPVLDETATGDDSASPWQRSFNPSHAADSAPVALFRVGACLAEVIDDLRRAGPETDARHWIDLLNRDFGNLRDAAADPASSLVEPVASDFGEHLLDLSDVWPALTDKCLDLERQLRTFARRLTAPGHRRRPTVLNGRRLRACATCQPVHCRALSVLPRRPRGGLHLGCRRNPGDCPGTGWDLH